MELQPAVDGNFWRGVCFCVPMSLAMYVLIAYAVCVVV